MELESSRGWCGGQEGRLEAAPKYQIDFLDCGRVFLSWTYVQAIKEDNFKNQKFKKFSEIFQQVFKQVFSFLYSTTCTTTCSNIL